MNDAGLGLDHAREARAHAEATDVRDVQRHPPRLEHEQVDGPARVEQQARPTLPDGSSAAASPAAFVLGSAPSASAALVASGQGLRALAVDVDAGLHAEAVGEGDAERAGLASSRRRAVRRRRCASARRRARCRRRRLRSCRGSAGGGLLQEAARAAAAGLVVRERVGGAQAADAVERGGRNGSAAGLTSPVVAQCRSQREPPGAGKADARGRGGRGQAARRAAVEVTDAGEAGEAAAHRRAALAQAGGAR